MNREERLVKYTLERQLWFLGGGILCICYFLMGAFLCLLMTINVYYIYNQDKETCVYVCVCVCFNGPERKHQVQIKIHSDSLLSQSRFLSPSLEIITENAGCVRLGLAPASLEQSSREGLS